MRSRLSWHLSRAPRRPAMHPVIVEKCIAHYGDVRVLIAHDPDQRSFVGVGNRGNEGDEFVFVQVDRVTMLEVERGMVDLYTLIAERCVGMAFEASASDVDRVCADARPTVATH